MPESKRSVLVSVTAESHDDHGASEGAMGLIMPGTLADRPDGVLLRYEETLEDENDHTSVTHDVRLLLRRGHVTLLRKGPYSMMLVLEKGKRYETTYHTPYGDMPMAVYPTVVDCRLKENGGRVELVYQLDLQGGFAAERRMVIVYALQKDKC